jgi:hypothetical protein
VGCEACPERGHYCPGLVDPSYCQTVGLGPAPAHAIPLAGDLVEALARRIGADRLSKWVEAKTGQPCACEERRQKLNRLDEKLRRFLSRGGTQ